MQQYAWIFIAVFALVFLAVSLHNRRINGEIDRDGIETDAVVSRVYEHPLSGMDGRTAAYTYYVTYRSTNGQSVEAELGSGKSVDLRVGKKDWDSDLKEGTPVRIKYLPGKPDFAIRIR